MRQTLAYLTSDSLAFPPLESALSEPNGLIAIGGDLSTKRIISAYQNGIFPWFGEQEPIMWWSPDPRAIIPIGKLKVNRTLKKELNRHKFTVTINHAFEEVIALCADAPFRQQETWIVDEMIDAYCQLHQQGHAHSIEVWQEEQLVGGLYGVAINQYFSGESMFYQTANASKIALVALHQLLTAIDAKFIDCQLQNPFLASMGCIEIPRDTFKNLQQTAITKRVDENIWQPRQLF